MGKQKLKKQKHDFIIWVWVNDVKILNVEDNELVAVQIYITKHCSIHFWWNNLSYSSGCFYNHKHIQKLTRQVEKGMSNEPNSLIWEIWALDLPFQIKTRYLFVYLEFNGKTDVS